MLFTDHLGYRDVLVTNNSASASDRLAFYAINLEHSMAEANGEFANAAHVDIIRPPSSRERNIFAVVLQTSFSFSLMRP